MTSVPDRVAVIGTLIRFIEQHDWTHPNWCKVRNQISRARKAWREDNGDQEDLDRAFNAAIGDLERKLKPIYAENCARKQAIIQHLKDRLDKGVSRVELAKVACDLQQEWKAIRPVPRRKDQKLWQDFRALCDEVFQG